MSPAAKSHRMRLSDREHYSQSLWIKSTAAPHDPFAFPQTNYLIRKQCMMGKPPECSLLTPPHPSGSGRCLRICLHEKSCLQVEGLRSCLTLTDPAGASSFNTSSLLTYGFVLVPGVTAAEKLPVRTIILGTPPASQSGGSSGGQYVVCKILEQKRLPADTDRLTRRLLCLAPCLSRSLGSQAFICHRSFWSSALQQPKSSHRPAHRRGGTRCPTADPPQHE